MQCTTITVPSGSDQATELRRLIALARRIGIEWQIWPGPSGSPGDTTFHAWGDLSENYPSRMQDSDPILTLFRSHLYLFGDDVEREAEALPLDALRLR